MEIFTELGVDVLASFILLGFGFIGGKYRERKLQQLVVWLADCHYQELSSLVLWPFL